MSTKTSSKKIAKLAADLLPGLKIAALLGLISFAGVRLHAQALPTATSAGVLQAGGEFKYHWGIEAEFHQINDSDPTTKIYDRTYEIGPRYVLHFQRIEPFAKA